MTKYTLYNLVSGAIIRSGEATGITAQIIAEQVEDTETQGLLLESFDDSTFFVSGGWVVPRPNIECNSEYNLDIDTELVIEVPINTNVEIDGSSYLIEDGTLEFSSSIAKSCELRIIPPFPYQPKLVMVVVS